MKTLGARATCSSRLFTVDAERCYIDASGAIVPHDPAIADAAATVIAANPSNFPTPADRRAMGYLTEALVLRRYAEALERHRSDDLGVPGLAR